MNEHSLKVASYAGGGTAIIAGLTMNEIGAIVGIAIALATFLLNAWFVLQRDRREKRLLDYQMGNKPDRRSRIEDVRRERRKLFSVCKTCPILDAEEDRAP